VPIGVILMVYEARPHVTINAGAFCLKAGNAVILRGGSEARRCNRLLGRLWQEALEAADLPGEAVQVVSGSHADVREMLEMDDLIDLIIPRGSKKMVQAMAKQCRVPIIKHDEGICHVYVDEPADVASAINITLDSKCLMPEVCNAAETLLVARKATGHLPELLEALQRAGVALRGCDESRRAAPGVAPATDDDWATEYLDMTLAVRVVEDVEAAIDHINHYGSHHTDTIVTANRQSAERFVAAVDSGVVLVNASTMFCDGQALGMGAEIGISTGRLHARGPMGLEELTTYKFVIEGRGEVMGAWE